ncbi:MULTISPECIES: cation diffusion facilitator family transporter [Actinomycetes]|uniref:Cation transporter n=1 Tax=Quadrisphaera setariae TaxID=2593304 RepID=A0A5C8Z4Z7_9ACTN|nr:MULTISPECIES: cation diffusion facilitator family transporter [Actinomycetes]TNM60444.1 cation transporter [Streptomyces sp. NP160]TXR52414.1 cation transporter [Quadrisphaera setariae]
MPHDHSSAAAGEQHAGCDQRRRLAIALTITVAITAAGLTGGLLTGSLALLADAGHALTDAAGLAIALVAATLALRPATDARTWGFRRAEVIAAAVQAVALLGIGVFVIVEAIRRFSEPPEVASSGMVLFGAVGLLGNVVAIWVLTRGGHSHAHGSSSNGEGEGGGSSPAALRSLNMKAALLEVINDALGSLAVIIAAVVIATTGWTRADAVASLLIGALIIPRTVRLLRESAEVLLESTPRGLDLAAVREHLLAQEHVLAVHDLHASQISTGLPVLSAHVVVEDSCFHDGHAPQVLDALQQCLAGHFPISVTHSTFQIEPSSHSHHEAGAHS